MASWTFAFDFAKAETATTLLKAVIISLWQFVKHSPSAIHCQRCEKASVSVDSGRINVFWAESIEPGKILPYFFFFILALCINSKKTYSVTFFSTGK